MKITRAASISGQEIVANLASRMRRDDPLVICTDGSSREEIFGPIQKHFRETIFLDRYLRESASIRDMIAQLPRDDESVHALLTQLVASKAQVFAGTLFSTFTALIHRLRGFDRPGVQLPLLLQRLPLSARPLRPLRVSPRRRRAVQLEPDPLSRLARRVFVAARVAGGLQLAPPPFGEEASPAGTLDLLAGEATVHGSAIRCLEEDGGQMVIGDWTDQSAFVTWDVALAAGGTIRWRYGTPAPEGPRAVGTASASREPTSSTDRCGTPGAGSPCRRGSRSDGSAFPPAAAR